jgi:hypothetical protein
MGRRGTIAKSLTPSLFVGSNRNGQLTIRPADCRGYDVRVALDDRSQRGFYGRVVASLNGNRKVDRQRLTKGFPSRYDSAVAIRQKSDGRRKKKQGNS